MAIGLLAAGHSQDSIAVQVGCSQKTISDIGKKYRDKVQQAACKIITENIDNICKFSRLAISKGTHLLQFGTRKQIQDNSVLLSLAQKEKSAIAKMVGIEVAHTRALTINQLFQPGSVQIYEPHVTEAIKQIRDAGDVLDADIASRVEFTEHTEPDTEG